MANKRNTTKNTNIEMHRQGDLLITKCEALPDGLVERTSNVILEGEVTGHAHKLVHGRILEDAKGFLFLEILRNTQIVHEEHNAISLEPGYYQITRQREYSPEAIRLVVD